MTLDHSVEAKTRGKPRNRFRFGIGSMLVMVACFAAFFWAWRTVGESMRPSKGWAKALRSGNVEERRVAAHQLGDFGLDDVEVVVPTLLQAMNDPDEAVAAAATTSMGEACLAAMRSPVPGPEVKAAGSSLIAALNDPRVEVRTSAVLAIAKFAGPMNSWGFPSDPARLASALADRMTDASPKVRHQTALALGLIGSVAGIEPPESLLMGLSRWDSAETRADAAEALGLFTKGTDRAVPALIARLKDQDRRVRTAAAASLGKFGPRSRSALPGLVELLAESYLPPPPMPDRIALMRFAPPPVGGLFEAPHFDPVVEAAESIGEILAGTNPPPEVVDALIETLQRSREPFRKHAVEVAFLEIGRGASKAIVPLIADLGGSIPGHGGPAASALGVMAPGTPLAPQAIAALTAALDSSNSAIRLNAAIALAQFGLAAAPALPRLKALDRDPDRYLAQAAKATVDAIMAAARPAEGTRDAEH